MKVRAAEERIFGCFEVQRHLWAAGFPCAEPLAGPSKLDEYMITAESLMSPGQRLEGGSEVAAKFAGALAELVSACGGIEPGSNLDPAPPWMGWSHAGPALWPTPDDLDVDLNAHAGPDWLDDAAARVREVLRASKLPKVVGHVDWHSGNVEWLEGRLHAVHDFDSVAYMSEPAIAGGASVLYVQSSRAAASVAESEAFLRSYEEARDLRWTADELQEFWAAGLWNLAFDAKKQTIDGKGGGLQALEAELQERLRLAGVS